MASVGMWDREMEKQRSRITREVLVLKDHLKNKKTEPYLPAQYKQSFSLHTVKFLLMYPGRLVLDHAQVHPKAAQQGLCTGPILR